MEGGFPVFVGGPRLYPPRHPFWEEGNYQRELLALDSRLGRDEEQRRLALHSQAEDIQRHVFLCSECGAYLPSAHLLDVHVLETHDSFFAAQAARKMKVFVCLVEGCHKRFCSFQERRQHLVDTHCFPRDINVAKICARHHGGQPRLEREPRAVLPARSQPTGFVPDHAASLDKAVASPSQEQAVSQMPGGPFMAEQGLAVLQLEDSKPLLRCEVGSGRGRARTRGRGQPMLGRACGRRGRSIVDLS